MNRRGFLRRVFGGVAAAALAPFIPSVPAAKPLGLSMRFIRSYYVSDQVTRFDMIYGMSVLRPELTCRISEGHIGDR